MSISSLSKRNVNVNVNVNVTADAVGKVGKNDLDFCGLRWKGWMDGRMDGWKQRDITFFGAGCLYAAICLERPILGEIWEGGDSWVGLDYC